MTPNPQLALAIPTCNHPDLIQTSITAMLPELTQFNIPVYVSDNSTTLDTEQVVAALQIEYPYIYYRRNKQNLGYDANCHLAITWPDTDFVWPIGDGMIIRPGGIAAVLRWVSPDRDFIFVNCRVPNLKNEVVNPSDIRSFLIEVTWHITLLGATVYGRRPRSIDITPEQRVSWKNFIHLGLILFYITTSNSDPVLVWHGPHILEGNPHKKASGWVTIPFDVFAGDWVRLIRAFSNYFTPDEVQRIARSHAVKTGIFNIHTLVRLRLEGRLTPQIIEKYDSEIRLAVPVPIRVVRWIANAPMGLCRFLIRFV